MDADRKAKLEFIASFFDNAESRVNFVEELHRSGHRSEARTLCLTYIDSFSQWLQWPGGASGRNFVDAVVQYGGDEFMALVHPLEVVRSLSQMKGPWPGLAARVAEVFPGPQLELLAAASFEVHLGGHLTAGELKELRKEMWRGTIAHVAYKYLRNPSVHAFGSSDGIYFSRTTFQGEPVSPLGFSQMLHVVRGLVAEVRRRSEESGQWFGNDRIVLG